MFSTELLTLNYSVNQSVNQSVSHSVSQPASQPLSQSISQSISSSAGQRVKIICFFLFWEQSVDLNHFMCSPGKKLYSINAKI